MWEYINMAQPPEEIKECVPPRIISYLQGFAKQNPEAKWLWHDEELHGLGGFEASQNQEWQKVMADREAVISSSSGTFDVSADLQQSKSTEGETVFVVNFYDQGNPPPIYFKAV